MNYEEVEKFLFSQLPMYQRLGGKAIKTGLENITAFCKALGHPEKQFKSIHIAGTNGKGSTAHFLASVLQEAGYKVGLHTSPHLKDFRERIKINGEMISKEEVVSFVEDNFAFTESLQPSFFEWAVALSFDHFAKNKVAIAIIETGLGGRLDSTNIIVPEVSVITNIGLDHCQFLGNDLASIAGEKAGIIKQGVPVVLGEVLPETESVFKSVAATNNAKIFVAEPIEVLKGYQEKNIATVKKTLEVLKQNGWEISDGVIIAGIEKMAINTGLRGRWELIGEAPRVICDVGHNEDGLKLVASCLKKEDYERLHIVLGVSADKEVRDMLNLLPKEATYYYCKANLPRAMDQNTLQAAGVLHKRIGEAYPSVKHAYEAALQHAGPKDLVFVGGSVFVVGEVL